MRSTITIVLLAFATELAANQIDNEQDGAGSYDDKLMSKLMQGSSLYADLDGTVLGKGGQLAVSPRTSVSHVPVPYARDSTLQRAGYQPQAFRSPAPGYQMEGNTRPLVPLGASTHSISVGSTLPHVKANTRMMASRSTIVAASGSPEPVSVGLVGLGGVGKELVAQIESQKQALAQKGLDISVVAVAGSKEMFLGGSAATAAAAKEGGVPADLVKFGEFVAKQPGKKIVVDCTAADGPGEIYATWLAAGINVATPNKKLGSGPLSRYKSTFDAARSGGVGFFYEATVGAGLPIISTLQDLLDTGDKVEKIEGILSGTLSYLFNVGAGRAFSEVIQDAADKGFTEPDPRDDLSGTDVQRKALILARECGLNLEMDDIPVESLVPKELQTWEPTDADKSAGLAKVFIEKMKAFDGDMTKRMDEAAAAGEVLRYVATIDIANGKASVGLGRFPLSSPFAATQFADNIVSFATERYTPRPLVVQGPGAGGPVTAAGVFSDMLKAARTS